MYKKVLIILLLVGLGVSVGFYSNFTTFFSGNQIGLTALQRFARGSELDSAFSYDPKSRTVAFAHDSGVGGIFTFDLDSTHRPEELATRGVWPKDPILSPGGRYVAFFDADPELELKGRVLYLTDRETNNVSVIRASTPDDRVSRPSFSPDGRKLFYEYTHRKKVRDIDEFRVVELDSLNDSSFLKGGDGGARALKFSSDGSHAYYFSGLCVVRLEVETKARKSVACFPARTSLFPPDIGETPTLSPDDGRLLATIRSGGCPRIAAIDLQTGGVRFLDVNECGYRPSFLGQNQVVYIGLNKEGSRLVRVRPFEGGSARTIGYADSMTYRIAVDSEDVLALVGTPVSTRKLVQIDSQSGAVKTLVAGESVSIEGALSSSMTHLTVKSFDGRPIPVRIFRPACRRAVKGPAVLYIHGSPAGRDDVPPRLSREIGYLLGKGITVIAVNYRGSTGYGDWLEKFESRNHQVQDLIAVTKAVSEVAEIDPPQLYAFAICYAAENLLPGLVAAQGEKFRGVIAWSGALSPLKWLKPNDPETLWIVTSRDRVDPLQRHIPLSERERLTEPTEVVAVDDTHLMLFGESRLSALESVGRFITKRSGSLCPELE